MTGSTKKGRILRVSPEVFALLSRKRAEFRSYDSLLRCLLGLPARKGSLPRLREGFVIPQTGRFFEQLAKARGEAVRLAAARGAESIEKPVRMREVL